MSENPCGEILDNSWRYILFGSNFLGKENEMQQRINIEPLVQLADPETKKLYTELGLTMDDSGFAAELKELQDEEDKERRKAAAKEVLKVLANKREVALNKVSRIRDIRKEESRIKAGLKELDRAEAFGKSTGNFLPLVNELGLASIWQANQDIYKVPKDWNQTPETPAAS